MGLKWRMHGRGDGGGGGSGGGGRGVSDEVMEMGYQFK